MPDWKRISIKRKLLGLSVLGSSVALLLACSAFFGFDLLTFRTNMVRNLVTQADIVSINSASAILFHDAVSARQTLSALQARSSMVQAIIYTPNGKPFAIWKRDKDDKTHLLPQTVNAQNYRFDFNTLELFQPIVFDGANIGTVYIKSDLTDLKSRLRRYIGITLGVFLISFLGAIIISLKLGNKILEPILSLVQAANTVSSNKDYTVRAESKTDDEVGLLVQTFNQMLTEIQSNEEELRKSHGDLERRVQQRTAELEAAGRETASLNEFLDSIVENIPNMVFVKDATNLRFVRFNKEGETLLGYQREDLLGKNDYDFFPKQEADFFTSKDREVLINGELLDIAEEPIETKNKGQRILHTRKIPILDEKGTPQYLLGISEDITERKLAEKAIQALNEKLAQKAAQLEAANKELETFSYSVSHDLRAPLRAIDGFSLALIEDCGDKLNATEKDYLQRIRIGSQQMAQLIDDMLNLSRITRGALNVQTVNLSALAQAVIVDLKAAQPQRQINLDIADNLMAAGDPHLLRIVLENLLSNAWKFTSKKTNATIEFSISSNENSTKTYAIRDNGAGFDMAYSNKLFTPFQRLHSGADFNGTGVGLATVQRIIHRHGGRIWAEAEVGKGAAFYFTLG